MTRLDIKIDVRQIEALAGKLDRIEGSRLGGAALEAVNAVTVAFEKKSTAAGVADINLTQAYVKSKTDLQLATNVLSPRATITTRGDLTPLGNFDPIAIQRAGRGNSVPRRAGPRVGRRNAGILMSIKRSQSIKENQWFVLPLRRGDIPGGNGLGVFVRSSKLAPSPTATREGKAGKQQIYGPSPYMLFRKQITVQGPQLARDLSDEVVRGITAEIQKVL